MFRTPTLHSIQLLQNNLISVTFGVSELDGVMAREVFQVDIAEDFPLCVFAGVDDDVFLAAGEVHRGFDVEVRGLIFAVGLGRDLYA